MAEKAQSIHIQPVIDRSGIAQHGRAAIREYY